MNEQGHGMVVPAILRDGVGRTPAGAEWIERLPTLVARAGARWGLRLGPPFTDGAASWCAPATRADGRPLVLKVSFPHDEARHEAVALRAWHGHGVPELLGVDDDDWALLLERVEPGTPLSRAPGSARERLTAAADVARSLWSVGGQVEVPAMADVCAGWADLLEERGSRHGVDVRGAAELLRTLPGWSDTLVHGDLNPGNLLAAGESRWLAIDPKPMRGDPAYDLWPLLEQIDDPFEHPAPAAVLRERVALLAGLLDLDAARVAAWAFARCTESALWVWDQLVDEPGARAILGQAAVWARVAG
ncbi:aminoglycoside phosphotransferase family protein [Cellulomonas humilata]|uniref:Streptomycin 6-kinase n=1 Tax=Cellulomonas humilata TaxID=144055 RepID=A0ABU0EHW4_9CELL|nr:aminoglycoside phosphotransferase family protein [Cellulomonas humilata]MDQ0374863.1 streptomycin 6-kinase [Cellulomonas humilata]